MIQKLFEMRANRQKQRERERERVCAHRFEIDFANVICGPKEYRPKLREFLLYLLGTFIFGENFIVNLVDLTEIQTFGDGWQTSNSVQKLEFEQELNFSD